MLCQKCQKRTATIHITKIINNKKTEKHLCEVCAHESEEMDFSLEPTFSFHQLLAGLLGGEGIFSQAGDTGTAAPCTEMKCKSCHLTYSQFRQIGRLGCSQCYETFASPLKPFLRRIHGSYLHNGKVPVRTGGALRFKKKKQHLREELQKKISAEAFEEAARIRDELRQMAEKFEERGE